MSERKWTPGPWVADVRHEECAYLHGPENSYPECYFENAHDARLIAAAPDLYEALEGLLNGKGASMAHIMQAHAALAKARGEA